MGPGPVRGVSGESAPLLPELNATRLYREVRAREYAGSYVTLCRFVNSQKGVQKVQAAYRFESPPGLQSQVDWTLFGHLVVDGCRHQLAELGQLNPIHLEKGLAPKHVGDI